MSEEENKTCYAQEHKVTLDDCGSVGCTLTKETWDEWKYEDKCMDCPFAVRDDEELSDWERNVRENGKCCVCEGSLCSSKHTNIVALHKIATWKHPRWENLLFNIPADGASAIVCDSCIEKWQDSESNELEVKYAVEFNHVTDEISYHPVDELEGKIVDYTFHYTCIGCGEKFSSEDELRLPVCGDC